MLRPRKLRPATTIFEMISSFSLLTEGRGSIVRSVTEEKPRCSGCDSESWISCPYKRRRRKVMKTR